MDIRIGTPSTYSKSKMVAENAPDSIPAGSYYLTMKDGSELVSSLIAKKYENSYVIRLVEVRGDYRGMGFGKRIMQEILEHLKPKKLSIILYVDPKNTIAVSLYKKLGFELVKRNTKFGDKYHFHQR